MITVMGASGHVGGRTADLLLDAGEKVRALGRSPEKLASLAGRGATGAYWERRGCGLSGTGVPAIAS